MKKLLIALLTLCMLFCACFMLACDNDGGTVPDTPPTVEKPDEDSDTTTPEEGGTTTPDEGDGDTTTPDDGDATTPDDGDTTTPDDGGSTTPDDGDITTPDEGDTTEHVHSLAYIPGKEPTCMEDGNIEHWKCIICNKKYIVAEQTTEVINVVLNKGHVFTNYISDDNASCEEDGTETAICNREGCFQTDTRTEQESALGHNTISHSAKEPTCTEIGWGAYETCSRCNYTTYTEESSLGHDLENHSAKTPTCLEFGWKDYDTCQRCDYSTYEKLLAIGHIYADGLCVGCEELQSKGLAFTLINNDTEYEVNRGTCTDIEIIIPSMYNNNSVTSIGEGAFSWCDSLESITIPDSVTSIGEWAFLYCFSLTSVTIGDSVTSIGEGAFHDCSSLTSVTIGDSVTSICRNAFLNCSSLRSITIPDSVTSIANGAFSSCTSLESVTIGDSVTSIGQTAFEDCSSLTEIIFNATAMEDLSKDNHVFRNAGKNGAGITVNIGANVTKIPAYLLYPYRYHPLKITSVVFAENSVCESIGECAFAGCTSLTSVTIPTSVINIGEDAFAGCGLLVVDDNNENYSSQDGILYNKAKTEFIYIPKGICGSITIPDSVTSIGDNAFSSCSSLESITIPDSVTSIGYDAFYNCSSLTSVTIGDSVTSIGEYAFFECSSLETVYYNGDIDGWAMIEFGYYEANPLCYADHLYINGEDYKQKTSIELTSATKIASYAFYEFSKLESVTIPNSVTSIGDSAFSGCDNLQYNEYDNGLYLGNENNKYVVLVKAKDTNITCSINENTKFIHSSAFHNCWSLTSITIPNSVTSIGSSAFSWCGSLESVTIGDSVTSIGEFAFDGCSSLTSVIIGEGVTSIGDSAFRSCSLLTNITIPDSVTSIGEDAFYGTEFYKNSANWEDGILYIDNWLIEAKDDIEYCSIKEGIEFIAGSAFRHCSTLTSITIPDSVTSIGSYAFYGCSSLTSINIPDSVTSIDWYAFYGCSSLTSITIGDSVTSIGSSAFWDCSSLRSITIPDSVTSIGKRAFYGCSRLTSVTIGDSVTSIGSYAFEDCFSLTDINYNGTMAEWNAINKHSSWNSNIGDYVIHCTDGDIAKG